MRGFSKLMQKEAQLRAAADESADRVSIRGGVIYVKVNRRSDEPQLFQIDLNDVWLPPTTWAPEGKRLIDREDLTTLILDSVTTYLRRNGESKSTDSVTRNITGCLCKFFEYGWINNCYEARDWTAAHTERLLNELALGGWSAALRVQERTSKWIASAIPIDIATTVNPERGLREELLRSKLLTNAKGRELTPALALIRQVIPQSVRYRKHKTTSTNGMSVSMLRQTLGWINLLADVPEGGLPFTPFENIFQLSLQRGRPIGRTKNISPGEVGVIMSEAFKWIYQFSTPVMALFEELADAFEKNHVAFGDRHNYLTTYLPISKYRPEVEEKLGVLLCGKRVKGVDALTVPLHTVAQALFDACFVAIGFMNARRAAEIQSSRVGIYYEALSVFDERLGLYECDFYLEKYRKGYKRFFVNGATAAAIELLKKTSNLAIRLRAGAGLRPSGEGNITTERKISQIPRFVRIKGDINPEWFSFNAGPNGNSRFFFERAFKGTTSWHLRPHMLRRAYALIYFYRYENGELLALAQQLDHFSVETTGTYLSDASVRDGRVERAAFGRVSDEEKALLDLEQRSIDLEMEDVHNEKMRAFIDCVVRGTELTSGGLGKLMRRFHTKLSTRLDYSGLDQANQGRVLMEAVAQRGHRLRPFRHGDCGVPEGYSHKRLARCYDDKAHGLDKSQASPILCHKCPYHRSTKGHLEGLRNEKVWMMKNLETMPSGSMLWKREIAEISNLEKVICFHAAVMEGE